MSNIFTLKEAEQTRTAFKSFRTRNGMDTRQAFDHIFSTLFGDGNPTLPVKDHLKPDADTLLDIQREQERLDKEPTDCLLCCEPSWNERLRRGWAVSGQKPENPEQFCCRRHEDEHNGYFMVDGQKYEGD